MTEQTWRDRERERQKTRTMPIWSNEPFWAEQADRHMNHFVHLSESKPPMIAYTVDANKGERDIQTATRAGRYLTRYFSDVLTAKQIAYYAAWQTNGTKPQGDSKDAELKFARTAKEIFDVYARGPTSCMDAEHFSDPDESPVRVYAAGDLAIAYLEGEASPGRPNNDVLARALVWPDKKVAGRVYPTEGCQQADGYGSNESAHMAPYYALQHKLKDEGYRFINEGCVDFNDARLLKLEADEGDETYVMPYLDNNYGVDDCSDKYWKMSTRPDHSCQETQGWIRTEPEYAWTCDNCDEGQHEDSYSTTVYTSERRSTWGFSDDSQWCEYCADTHAFRCEGFNERFSESNVESVEVNGRIYARLYVEKNFYESDYSNEWFDPDDDASVEMNNGEKWAESEFEKHGFECVVSGEKCSKHEMHPDHHNVWCECTDESISEHLEKESVE